MFLLCLSVQNKGGYLSGTKSVGEIPVQMSGGGLGWGVIITYGGQIYFDPGSEPEGKPRGKPRGRGCGQYTSCGHHRRIFLFVIIFIPITSL